MRDGAGAVHFVHFLQVEGNWSAGTSVLQQQEQQQCIRGKKVNGALYAALPKKTSPPSFPTCQLFIVHRNATRISRLGCLAVLAPKWFARVRQGAPALLSGELRQLWRTAPVRSKLAGLAAFAHLRPTTRTWRSQMPTGEGQKGLADQSTT